jgi:FKBP-type peptidyl-prolyl cis-trans isomerase FkpA
MKTHSYFFVLLLFASFLSACNTYSDDEKQSFGQETKAFADKKGWKVERSESGLCVQILREGDGTEVIQTGSIVTITYKGTLKNGKTFDQTEPGKPLKANLKGLIGGFQEGLLGQKKGAQLRLIIPPQLGYGDQKQDKIPGNSILIFDIEIVDFI